MRAQIEPDFKTARKRYGEILKRILAYTAYCDDNGDPDGAKYRELEAALHEIIGKNMSKFDLWEWREANCAENLAFDIALPEPQLVSDITKDELREIVERMSTFEPRETGDAFLDAFYYRASFTADGGYFTEYLKLNFKNTYDPRLFERCERNSEMSELSAGEITQILWGERGEK